MGVVKAVNSPSSSHAALRNTLEYILKDSKTSEDLKLVAGMYFEPTITVDAVFRNFTEQRATFGKDNGRMFKHFILSWSKDEDITPELGLAITNEWVEQIFPEFNAVIVSHTDRDHVHCHIVVNSVNNVTGKKLRISKSQFQDMKDINDALCKQYGLSVVEKGKHFDGSKIPEGTMRSYKKKTFRTLTADDDKRKVLADILVKVLETSTKACSQNEFVILLAEAGITTNWTNKRKYITFTDDATGIKVRDKKLGDNFTTTILKEILNETFIRNERVQRERSIQTGENDRGRELLEEEIRGNKSRHSSIRRGTESNRRLGREESETIGTERDYDGEDNFIKNLIEELQRRMGWRAQKSRIAGTGTVGSWSRRNKDMLSERERYELSDIAWKLEDLRFYYMNSSYEIMYYTPCIKKEPDYFARAINEMELSRYKNLLEYQSLMKNISPSDFKMLHDERLSIRERVENRHVGEYHNISMRDDADPEMLKRAKNERDYTLSHIVTTMELAERKHPEFREEREESQVRTNRKVR